MRPIFVLVLAFSLCLSVDIAFAESPTDGLGTQTESNYQIGPKVIKATSFSKLEYPSITSAEDSIVLIIHSSPYWDQEGVIHEAVLKHSHEEGRNGAKLFVLATTDERKDAGFDEFMKSLGTSTLLPFEGESNRLMFSGKRAAVLGGNFTQCACNAVRSLIALSEGAPLTIEFLTDGIYEIPSPSVSTPEELASIPQSQSKKRLLSDILKSMTDQKILEYLAKDYLANDTLPCPLYQPAFVSTLSKFRYSIYRGNQFIGSIGQEGQLIRMIFR